MGLEQKTQTNFDTALVFADQSSLEKFMQDNNVTVLSPNNDSVILAGGEQTYFSPWLHPEENGLIWSPGTREALELKLPILWDKKEDYFAWEKDFLNTTITQTDTQFFAVNFAALDIFQYHEGFLVAPPHVYEQIQEFEETQLIVSPWIIPKDMLWAIENNKPLGFYDIESYTTWRDEELQTEHNQDIQIGEQTFSGGHNFSTFSHLFAYLDSTKKRIINVLDYAVDSVPRDENIIYTATTVEPGMFQISQEQNIPMLWDSPEELYVFENAHHDHIMSRPLIRDPNLKPTEGNKFHEAPPRERWEDASPLLKLAAAAHSKGPYNIIGPKHQGVTYRKSGHSGKLGVRIDEGPHMEVTPLGDGRACYVALNVDLDTAKKELRSQVFKEYNGEERHSPRMIPILTNFIKKARESGLSFAEVIETGEDYLIFEKISGFSLGELIGLSTKQYESRIDISVDQEQAREYLSRAIVEIGKENTQSQELLTDDEKAYILALDYGIVAKSILKGQLPSASEDVFQKLLSMPEDEFFMSLPIKTRQAIVEDYPALRQARYLERSDSEGDLVLDVKFVADYMTLCREPRSKLFNRFSVWSSDSKPDNLIIPFDRPNAEFELGDEIVNVDPLLELSFLHKDYHLTAGNFDVFSLSNENIALHDDLLHQIRSEYMRSHNIPDHEIFPYMLAEWISGFEIHNMEAKNMLNTVTNNPNAGFIEIYRAVREAELRRSMAVSSFYAFVSHLNGFNAHNPNKPDINTMTIEYGQDTFPNFDDIDYGRPGFIEHATQKYQLSDDESSILEKTMYITQQMDRAHFTRIKRVFGTKTQTGSLSPQDQQTIFDHVYNHPLMFGSIKGSNPTMFFDQIISGAEIAYQTSLDSVQ